MPSFPPTRPSTAAFGLDDRPRTTTRVALAPEVASATLPPVAMDDAVRRERQRLVPLAADVANAQAAAGMAPHGPNTSPALTLPQELWLQVRSTLSGRELAQTRAVSQSWRAAAEDPLLPYRREQLAAVLLQRKGAETDAAFALRARALLLDHFAPLAAQTAQADAAALLAAVNQPPSKAERDAWWQPGASMQHFPAHMAAKAILLRRLQLVSSLHACLLALQPRYAAVVAELQGAWELRSGTNRMFVALAGDQPLMAHGGEFELLRAALLAWQRDVTAYDLGTWRRLETPERQLVAQKGAARLLVQNDDGLLQQLRLTGQVREVPVATVAPKQQGLFLRLREEGARLWQFVLPADAARLSAEVRSAEDERYICAYLAAQLLRLMDGAALDAWCLAEVDEAAAYRAYLGELGSLLRPSRLPTTKPRPGARVG